MNSANSNLFESSILNNTIGNDSILLRNVILTAQQKDRIQQSQAMFSELNKNQFQKCEEDYVKNQHIIQKYLDKENDLSKSASSSVTGLSFGLLFSPNDNLEFQHSMDENVSTRDEIFVFSVPNIEKIAQFLNLNYDKLKDLFIKVIHDEKVSEDLLNDLKMNVDKNETHSEQLELDISKDTTCKNLVFNQSTQTTDEYVQVPQISTQQNFTQFETPTPNESIPINQMPSSFNNRSFEQNSSPSDQVRPPDIQDHQNQNFTNSGLNLYMQGQPRPTIKYNQLIQPTNEFIYRQQSPIHEKHVSICLSPSPNNISSRLISYVDAVLTKIKSSNDVSIQDKNCSSPDLFSDLSDEECIPQT